MLEYLGQALSRAGRSVPDGPVETEELTGGATSNEVSKVIVDDQSYVLKKLPLTTWRTKASEAEVTGEGHLWKSGAVSDLGPEIRWPIVDVSVVGDEHWILMDDVSEGFRRRGEFTRADSGTLFSAIAKLHARYYGSDELDGLPIPTASEQIRMFTAATAEIAGRREGPRWVRELIDSIGFLRPFTLRFLEILGSDGRDRVFAIHDDLEWHDEFAAHPATHLPDPCAGYHGRRLSSSPRLSVTRLAARRGGLVRRSDNGVRILARGGWLARHQRLHRTFSLGGNLACVTKPESEFTIWPPPMAFHAGHASPRTPPEQSKARR